MPIDPTGAVVISVDKVSVPIGGEYSSQFQFLTYLSSTPVSLSEALYAVVRFADALFAG